MSNRIDILVETYGKERISRVLEVLDVLGGELPENFDIKDRKINLLGKQDQESKNYIEFKDNATFIQIEKDGHNYDWRRWVGEDDSIDEYLYIDNVINTYFFLTCDATVTSSFYLYSEYNGWASPKIFCDTCNVKVEGQTYSYEEYYDVIVSYLTGNNNYSFKKYHIDNYKPRLLDNPDIINILIKLFENQIKNHIYDLKNNDQSWRFTHEGVKIYSAYSNRIKGDFNDYSNALKEALDGLSNSLKWAKKIKEERLTSLEELHEKYKQTNTNGDNSISLS